MDDIKYPEYQRKLLYILSRSGISRVEPKREHNFRWIEYSMNEDWIKMFWKGDTRQNNAIRSGEKMKYIFQYLLVPYFLQFLRNSVLYSFIKQGHISH